MTTPAPRRQMPVTLQLSALYALAFGRFVAFSVYLPTYLVMGSPYGSTGDHSIGYALLAAVAAGAAAYTWLALGSTGRSA